MTKHTARYTSTCWCGKPHPCNGKDHDLLLKVGLDQLKSSVRILWVAVGIIQSIILLSVAVALFL